MTNIKKISVFILLVFTFTTCSQTKGDRIILGKSYAEQELKSTLSGNLQQNVIGSGTIILNDSLTAINVAEPVLFSIYGRNNIIRQRPYEIYLIGSHWVISGTLPADYHGGTFLIIIDSRDSRIVRISHGK